MEDEKYLMWLSRVKGIADKRYEMLLEQFGSAESVFRASRQMLSACAMLDPKTVLNILEDQDEGLLASYTREISEKNIRFISRFHPGFPPLLREIHYPPMGLYVVGDLPDEASPLISVIGSRRCSEYGLTVSYKLSRDLASRGVIVVSGMARGIDSQSHNGALAAGGRTIAVLGCGVDICYPPENKALKEKIAQNGCVISEYPPKTPPFAAHFPARNRMISGMSQGLVVVESAKRSGTIITVDQALEQGRAVFAVPGNITSKLSQGTNGLIKQGAVPIDCCEDILLHLGIVPPLTEKGDKNTAMPPLSLTDQLVYQCIGDEGTDVDSIARQSGLPIQEVNTILLTLELETLIQKLPGQRYIKM